MNRLFEVSITAIIHRADGRMLITRRSKEKTRFPGQWTCPGGHLEPADFNTKPTEHDEWHYRVHPGTPFPSGYDSDPLGK